MYLQWRQQQHLLYVRRVSNGAKNEQGVRVAMNRLSLTSMPVRSCSLRAACFLVLSLSMLTGTRRESRCPVSSGHDSAAAVPEGCVVLRVH